MRIIGWSFCFCKQKTAYEMRISDWSSDVCSSDLQADVGAELGRLGAIDLQFPFDAGDLRAVLDVDEAAHLPHGLGDAQGDGLDQRWKIGRASCRERVCPYV